MSQFEDMRAETADAPSASDFLVRNEAVTTDYGVAQVDNARELGAMQSLGTDLQSASNMAQALSTGASLTHGAAHTLRSVNEEGKRLPAVGGAVAEEARQGILDWLKQRPEAAWRFLKRETLPAWDPADVSEDSGDAATAEGNADVFSGTKAAVSAPGKIDRARGALHDSATGRLSQWDNKAVRQQNKADKIADKIARRTEEAGPATGVAKAGESFAKFRQRFHQSKAERLRGKGTGVLGGVLKVRRKKNEVQATVTRRQFLLLAGGGLILVPFSLAMVSSCSAGILGSVAGLMGSSSSYSDALSDVENQVASYLLAKGIDPLHVAAIMGNMFGESGMNPSRTEEGGTGIGICQWSGSRATLLRNYASSVGTEWSDLGTQLDFFWEHDSRMYSGSWGSRYVITDDRVNEHPGDPAVGDTVYGSKGGFEAATDLDEAVEQFCYGWESPGVPRLAARKEAAQRYYLALASSGSGGSGQDLSSASAAQRRVVNACMSTPSPGAGLCAAWVTDVFQNAGIGSFWGNADEMYYSWCTSSNRDDLKVGMIVAIDKYRTNGYAYAGHAPDGGNLSFHIGIYVGDNKVADNIGNIRTDYPLDQWISDYQNYSVVKWGWIGGVDLSAMR